MIVAAGAVNNLTLIAGDEEPPAGLTCKVWSTYGQVIPRIKRVPFYGSQCRC